MYVSVSCHPCEVDAVSILLHMKKQAHKPWLFAQGDLVHNRVMFQTEATAIYGYSGVTKIGTGDLTSRSV